MHSAFGIVLLIVVVGGVLVGIACLLLGGKTWEEFGRSGMVMEREAPRQVNGPVAMPGGDAERDEEIRQMLDARNQRRRRRGEAPLDVEAELARLTRPQVDAGLRDEIRQLVVARNHRRMRRGQPPLDVEAEVEREIAGLDGV